MLIKLRNFRCHTDKEINCSDTGLILFSGASGSGKSSILKAIIYALYGKIRKPYTFGSTTCSVTLEFMGLKITRTSHPNRLIVGDLEDAVAQSYIEDRLGLTYEEFMVSSYIPQKNNSSILSLAPTEQLKLIQTLAFENNCNEIYKEKLGNMVSTTSSKLIELRTECQFAQREHDRLVSELVPVDFPIVLDSTETKALAIENYRQRVQTFSKRIHKLQDKKESLTEKLHDYIYTKADLEINETKKDNARRQLADFEEKHGQLQRLLNEQPEDLAMQIKEISRSIKLLEQSERTATLKEQYEKLYTEELADKHAQLKRQQAILWIFKGAELDESSTEQDIITCRHQLNLWAEYQQATGKIQAIADELELPDPGIVQQRLDSAVLFVTESVTSLEETVGNLNVSRTECLQKLHQQELEKETLMCPNCNAKLRLSEQTLVTVNDAEIISDHDYQSEVASIDEQLETLATKKQRLVRLQDRLTEISVPKLARTDPTVYKHLLKRVRTLEKYLIQNQEREICVQQITAEIESGNLSNTIKSLRQQVEQNEAELNELKDTFLVLPTESLAALQKKLTSLEECHENYVANKTAFDKLEKRMIKTRQKYKQFKGQEQKCLKKLAGINPDALKKKLAKVESQITKAQQKHQEDMQVTDKLDMYLVYKDKKEQLDQWTEKLAQLVKQLKIGENVHTGTLILKEKYQQAEIMTVESTIESINEHTSYYLEQFFSDHQLTARLEPVLKGKKAKSLKVGTVINYKGNTYDNINQLSGGEFDRCTLASICGTNSLLNSPILILDESLASLDADINTEIINLLRELAQEKLILVCSHEAVRGIFDEIVCF